MTEPSKPTVPPATQIARAPYTIPRLNTFGTFAALTRIVGTTGLLRDKAGGGTNKTM